MAAATEGARLSIRSAGKRYGDLQAIADVTFDVGRNTIVSIVGPSGCGKTTLLWSMSGLHGLSEGQVQLDGHTITGPHPDIGLVFQEANLLPWRNLMQNILFPWEVKRQQPDMAWIDHLLERVGLKGFENRMPRELSGGMQQRASIVRSLSVNPSVLLMDEPFGALDAFTRDEMNLLIQEIWMETKKTIAFVTHSIAEAIFLADRVAVMSARPGRIAEIYDIDIPRPRSIDIQTEPDFIKRVLEIKSRIEHGRGGGARVAIT